MTIPDGANQLEIIKYLRTCFTDKSNMLRPIADIVNGVMAKKHILHLAKLMEAGNDNWAIVRIAKADFGTDDIKEIVPIIKAVRTVKVVYIFQAGAMTIHQTRFFLYS